jgi:hypothetical protein
MVLWKVGILGTKSIAINGLAIAPDEDDHAEASRHDWPTKRWEIVGVQRIAPAAAFRGTGA